MPQIGLEVWVTFGYIPESEFSKVEDGSGGLHLFCELLDLQGLTAA
jgi:hypothetical protein